MIKLNSKTQQDFLNKEWVQHLLDAGVDMSDARYCLNIFRDGIWIDRINDLTPSDNCLPTYTVSDLLYKLPEWITPVIDGIKYAGGLTLIKDAPFYIAYYDLKNSFTQEGKTINNYIHAACEYPIESLASILIQCHNKGIGDVGSIKDKFTA